MFSKRKPKKSPEQYHQDYLKRLHRRKKRSVETKPASRQQSAAEKDIIPARHFVKTGLLSVQNILFVILSFAIPLSLYLATSPQTVTGYADSASLITHAYHLDIAHPPGYPIFVLIGHLFSKIPIGTIAFRLSIMSSLFASLTSLLLYKLFQKLKLSPAVSLLSSLFISFTYSVWLYAITPEVFVLNNFLAVLLLYLTLKFKEHQDSGTKGSNIYLYLIAFVSGLGFANHMTIVLVVLPVFYFIYKGMSFPRRRESIQTLLEFTLCFIFGLSPYLFVIISSHGNNYPHYGNIPGLTRFIQYITRYDYGGLLSGGVKTVSNPNENYFGMFLHYLKLAINGLTIFSLPGIFYFIYKKVTRSGSIEQIIAVITILGGFVFPLFSLAGLVESDLHSQGVAERFGLLGFLFLGIAFVLGTSNLAEKFEKSEKKTILKIGLLLLISVTVYSNYKKIDKSRFQITKNYALNILNSLDDGDVVFTSDDITASALYYLSEVEKVKNIRLVSSGFLGNESYQKELKDYWTDLITTGSSYEFDVARNIIENTNKNGNSAYFVMFDDPYPFGFLGNPYYLIPQGLLLKADLNTNLSDVTKNSQEDHWENYDFTDIDKNYSDAYAKLLKNYYFHKAEVNATLYLSYGCQPCAETELKNVSASLPGSKFNKDVLNSLDTQTSLPNSARGLLDLAKSRFSAQSTPTQNDFHRTAWDLQRAYAMSPRDKEIIGGLAEIYEMLGIYPLAIKYYKETKALDPNGGWNEPLKRVETESKKFKLFDYL
ncbi:MAG: Transmembrane protein [Candidatus Woesebacteria bacterium GW2011_GWC1_38_13]|uniref:Transmembrane protein n=3 Tax=Candidatus Woeseibacteriota TaxID=1752722 RepID=A0A0G0KV74_9BACT|nr:MAG: Transmembrane protein [Candidatus Woesebacteria bacterium GW2011_GWD1_38_10]KKQ54506.1 MAG: Transmembrane protein [Candidatus Woesebacteria bacterium GW2011_GWC1_38_13]KKQ82657.1 MAG: Transmembrane protein [Candidatus Woesebacteria bacterium GW2011_GWA1_38_8]